MLKHRLVSTGVTAPAEGTKTLTQHRPSYVLFDVGNVLVHIEPAEFLRSLSIDKPDDRLLYQKRIIDIVRRYERGKDSSDDFFSNLDSLLNGKDGAHSLHRNGVSDLTRSELERAMLSIIREPVEGMEAIVRRVSAFVPMGILSNTNPIHFEYCLESLPVLQHIPSHFVSYHLGALKPEPEIFERAIEQVALPPEQILYIDDLAENVEASRAAGLMGHQFLGVTNIEQLFSELKLM